MASFLRESTPYTIVSSAQQCAGLFITAKEMKPIGKSPKHFTAGTSGNIFMAGSMIQMTARSCCPCRAHHTATAFQLLYVKQQEGCYIISVYGISLVIESLFLYHAAFLKERNVIAKNPVVIILVFVYSCRIDRVYSSFPLAFASGEPVAR